MTPVRQIWILAEGYDDRAFWSGWLTHLGATDARDVDKARWRALGLHERDRQGGGEAGTKGMFTFIFETHALLFKVVPVQEQQLDADALAATLADKLSLRQTAQTPYRAFIINQDDDTTASAPAARTPDAVRTRLRNRGEAFEEIPFGARLDDGTEVLQFTWRCDDADAPHLPAKQTLERLVCAAIGAVHPTRLKSLRRWLGERPEPTGADHKATAGGLWAGWSADDGWGDFYKAIWRDAAIARALLGRLAPLDAELRRLLAPPGSEPASK